MSTETKKTLHIVDGSAYIYRAYFAVRRLSNSRGFPTNALYGFVNMIKKLIEAEDPDHLAVTFDRYDEEDGKASFRHELYDQYKANRSAMPEDLRVQIPYFEKFIRAMNIPVMIESGVEADDVIATACRMAGEQGLGVCIASADKDLMQLLGAENVRMIDTMRDRTFTRADVIERFQVPPEKVKYVLALAGDTSDNVPGVPGIGEKTAGKLIAEFGDLETLLGQIDKVSGKKRKENLTEFADQARLSLELVTLRDDCPIEFDLEKLRVSPPDIQELSALLTELEFHSTLKDLKAWFHRRGWMTSQTEPARPVGPGEQASLFASQTPGGEAQSFEGTPLERPDKEYETILTWEALEEALAQVEAAERWAFDLETTSVEALDAEIVGMSFAWRDDHAVYVPLMHDGEGAPEQLDRARVLARIKPLLESSERKKIGQHVKYERVVLAKYGITFRGVLYDTMLMSYLLDPSRPSHSMNALAIDFLHYKPIAYVEVAGKGKKQIPFSQVAVDVATDYAAEDADVTLQLAAVLEPALVDAELVKLHDEMELPMSEVLSRMELEGIRIDAAALATMSVEFDADLVGLQHEINLAAGRTEDDPDLNPNSPKQLREVLFDELDLPQKKRTKSGPSTDSSVLEQLAALHPLPELILEYRQFAKLKGTYVDALPLLARPETGRVHTDFNQAVTATGRLSSSNPNLQNIPVRTARGRQIRAAFVPRDGWTMLGADYSQIELRIMAHMSEDPVMIAAYNEGEDIHALTAAGIFEVPIEEVTREQRGAGKTVNFAVIYGVGAHRLAQTLKVSYAEARTYIDNYFQRYEKIDAFFERLVTDAYDTGITYTMFGRRRKLPEIHARGKGMRSFAERVAKNTPIQGTSADIIKLAMIELAETIEQRGAPLKMLLQVHDELIFETEPDFAEEAKALIRETMEGIVELKVPLKVDVGQGTNWFDLK